MLDPGFSLDGKVALITGAASGIGAAIAGALARAGADIVAVHRGPIHATRRAVEATGSGFAAVQADLASLDAAGCAELIADAVTCFGRADILVNNAGVITRSPALDVTESEWTRVLHTNLDIVFFLTQAMGRHLASRGGPEAGSRGKVINIASMLSFQGGINVAAYTASKSGVAGLTRELANEWATLGINVNAIAPGYIATAATDALRTDPDRSAAILARIPAGRWGTPEDLAGAAVFLASAASDYLHGVILPVDGGWLAR